MLRAKKAASADVVQRYYCLRVASMSDSGSAEFASLQRRLVQNSSWFGISSIQFSSLFTTLFGKFIQFSSGHRGEMPPFSSFSSVHSVLFTNSSGPDSDNPGSFGSAQGQFSPSSLQLIGMSRGAVLGSLQRKSQPAVPGFVACLFVCLFIRV